MSRSSAAQIVLCLALVASFARQVRADEIPDPEVGHRAVVQMLVVDTSKVPPDRTVLFLHQRKFGGFDPKGEPEPFHSPYEMRRELTSVLGLFVVPKQLAKRAPTLTELEAQGIKPALLCGPPYDEVPEADPRWSMQRSARLDAAGGLELLWDVYYDKSGAVVCRRAPISWQDAEEGRDPCNPDARWTRVRLFVRLHRTAFGVGMAGSLVLLAAGVFLRRRRKKALER